MLDERNRPMMTYDNDDIVTLSRAWTGFQVQSRRGNIENPDGNSNGGTYMEPMQIHPYWRDPFPKLDLHDGYVGDGYPLCVDLPTRSFLRQGARFDYRGSAVTGDGLTECPSCYAMQLSHSHANLELTDASSPLHQALCSPSQDGSCQLASTVTLAATLPCHGFECETDPRLFTVFHGSTTAVYEWRRPACVEFPFYSNAKVTTMEVRARGSKISRDHCADPRTPVAGACCLSGSSATSQCRYHGERMTFAKATTRCAEASANVCPDAGTAQKPSDSCRYRWPMAFIRSWRKASCTLRAKVDSNGWLAIVHDPVDIAVDMASGPRPEFGQNSENIFRVAWEDGRYPDVSTCASTGCTYDATRRECLCDVSVEETRVFDALPSSAAAVEAQCHIGSLCPDSYDVEGDGASAYSLVGSNGEVEVYGRVASGGAGGGFDEHAIIKLRVASGHVDSGTCFSNRQSQVRIGGGGHNAPFSFRNAPHFVSFLYPTALDATHETEALLDHYFQHPNVAPFVSHHFIQRFTTSNPSPRYVRAVANAFRTGAYDGVTYSGRYGDLAAMISALLLDREARAVTLDADPHHGILREPLLKVHHYLRAMEFVSKDGREVEMPNIQMDIGMEAHKSPSVFNFYQRDYQPSGGIAAAGLYSPEAGLAEAPFIIGYLNGMTSLTHGLSACYSGFGRACANNRLRNTYTDYDFSDGKLTLDIPSGLSDASAVISELDLLLTGGRLNANATTTITSLYNQRKVSHGMHAAYQLAQQLFVATAEFHATNMQTPTHMPRPTPSSGGTSVASDFKAIIVLFFAGGVDSYNMLVPYSECPSKDMFAHYQTVRGSVHLTTSDLQSHTISNLAGSHNNNEAGPVQPCNTFAIHPDLDLVHELYGQGDAVFLANIGTLIEPIDRVTYYDGSRQLPPQIFAHNMGQKAAQNLHPQQGSSKGILGRMLDALTRQNSASVGSYSIAGNAKAVDGELTTPDVISRSSGTVRLAQGFLGPMLAQVLAPTTSSIFGETFSRSAACAGLKRAVL